MPARHTGPLARYACAIRQQRDDHNGKVLTIREHDLRSLARVYDVQKDNLAELLVNPGALTADPSAGAADRTHQSE